MKKAFKIIKRYWAIFIFLILAVTATTLPSGIIGLTTIGWGLIGVAPKEQKEYAKIKAQKEAVKRGLNNNLKYQYP